MPQMTAFPLGPIGPTGRPAQRQAFGDVPDDVVSSDNWISWVTNNAVPDSVADYVAAQVLDGEQILHDWFNALDQSRDFDPQPDSLPQDNRDYVDAFQKHNTMKFWCMLVGPLRSRLIGKVKAPSISVLQASKSEPNQFTQAAVAALGFDPFVPTAINEFVQKYLQDRLLAAAKSEGAVLDGLGRSGHLSSGGLGLLPALPAAAIVAIIIAGMIVAYVAIKDGLRTRRDSTRADLIKSAIEAEAAGKLPPGTAAKIQAQANAAEAAGDKNDPLSNIAGIAYAIGGLAALVLLGPPLIELFKGLSARKAAA